MMDPMVDVVHGFRPVMPTFLGTLPQPEAAAIVEFIKSLAHQPPESEVVLPKVEVATDDAGVPGQETKRVDERSRREGER